jgi:hypothetical protein
MASEALAQSTVASTTKAASKSSSGDTYQSSFKPNTSPAAKSASIGAATTVASISSQNGIIVLNSTPELGLTTGATITLIQDLTALGKVKITQVTDQLAIANILPGTQLKLSAGDSVKILH